MNKTEAIALSKSFENMVSKWAEENGLTFSKDNYKGKYSDSTMVFNGVQFIQLGNKDEEDVLRERFERMAGAYGLIPEAYGKIILIQGRKFTIVGIKESARKNFVMIKDVLNGQTYKTNLYSIPSEWKVQKTLTMAEVNR